MLCPSHWNNTSDCRHTKLSEGSANVTATTLPSVRSDQPSLCRHLLPYIYIYIYITKTTSATLGNKYTILTGDQATYELGLAIRNIDAHIFATCFIVRGFHLVHNYMKAISEEILVNAGLNIEGTAKKICGEKTAYYQSMYAL